MIYLFSPIDQDQMIQFYIKLLGERNRYLISWGEYVILELKVGNIINSHCNRVTRVCVERKDLVLGEHLSPNSKEVL